MKMKKEIKLWFRMPLVIFLLFAVYCCLQTRIIGKNYNQISKLESPRNEAALKMESKLIAIGCEIRSYLVDHEENRIGRIKLLQDKFRDYQKVYYNLSEGKSNDISMNTVDALSTEIRKKVEELINLNNYSIEKKLLLAQNFNEIEELLTQGFGLHSDLGAQGDYKKLETVMQMRNKVDSTRRNLNAYLKTHKAELEENIYENQKELAGLSYTYHDLRNGEEHKQWFEQFDKVYTQSMLLINEIVALDKKEILNLRQFHKAKEDLQTMLGTNLIRTQAQLNSLEQASDKMLAIFVLLNPLLAILGFVFILLFQAYGNITVEQAAEKTADIGIDINKIDFDTTIQIPPPKKSGQLSESEDKS